jgi:L-asparaginase/Glu-tRNA(Gln) amidotransferase subunit D
VDAASAHPLLAERGPQTGDRRIEVPAGGLVPLPYAGSPDDGAQTFFPSAERLYDEIDALEIDDDGRTHVLGRLAEFEFHRAGAPAGYEAAGEVAGRDFFPYGETVRRAEPDFAALVRITNTVQAVIDGPADAVQWLEGTPVIEESLYWLGLLIDTTKPIVGQVAQRMHRAIGSDGPRNLFDGVGYVVSRAWAGPDGSDLAGPVLVTDGVVLPARELVKLAGRPGGYSAGAFGPIAILDRIDRQRVEFLPTRRSGRRSLVNTRELPATVTGLHGEVRVTDGAGRLDEQLTAAVEIVKYGRYGLHEELDEPLVADRVAALRAHAPLAGLVLEGLAQNGWASRQLEAGLRRAAFSGIPVVWAARGTPHGPTGLPPEPFVSAAGLSASKARILLLAALLRYGSAPAAVDPDRPTPDEIVAVNRHRVQLQALFDTH